MTAVILAALGIVCVLCAFFGLLYSLAWAPPHRLRFKKHYKGTHYNGNYKIKTHKNTS